MQRCPLCHRHLREGLYADDPRGIICNSCLRKEQVGRGKTSVNRTFVTDELNIPSDVIDPTAFIRQQEMAIGDSLRSALLAQGRIKWYPASVIRLTRSEPEGEARVDVRFTSPPQILLREDEIASQVTLAVQTMLTRCEDFMEHGSDFKIESLLNLNVLTATYNPVGGSSYIPLPNFLINKKALVNIKNTDECCFKWSVLASIHPADDHPDRLCHYKKFASELNFDNIVFPVKLCDIPKFEKQNPTLTIGVLQLDDCNRVVPLYASKYWSRTSNPNHHHINLFYLSETTNPDGSIVSLKETPEPNAVTRSHYVLVKSLSRLLRSETNYTGPKMFPCPFCLHRFTKDWALPLHMTRCSKNEPCRIFFPSKEIKVRKAGDENAEEEI